MTGELSDATGLRADPTDLPDGAHLVRGFLDLEQQRWLVERFHEWTQGPAPIRAAKVRGHEMSVRTVCLGWHWHPYAYTRDAVDVNGRRVLDFPDWMTRLGRRALTMATGDPAAVDTYHPDTALVNYYDTSARMGMHQDKDEIARDPVVSLSIGNRDTRASRPLTAYSQKIGCSRRVRDRVAVTDLNRSRK